MPPSEAGRRQAGRQTGRTFAHSRVPFRPSFRLAKSLCQTAERVAPLPSGLNGFSRIQSGFRLRNASSLRSFFSRSSSLSPHRFFSYREYRSDIFAAEGRLSPGGHLSPEGHLSPRITIGPRRCDGALSALRLFVFWTLSLDGRGLASRPRLINKNAINDSIKV